METNTNKKLIVGVIITSAIGLFSWRFYKTYKDVKGRMDEEEMIEIEAEIEEVANLDQDELRIRELSAIHGSEAVEEAEQIMEELTAKKKMREHVRDTQIAILEEEEEHGVDIDEVPGIGEEKEYLDSLEEEEEKLRHHPDSQAAWDQYVNMRLADIDDPDLERFYRILMNVDYYPIEDGRDHIVESNITNDRTLFFGGASRFVGGMTIGELLLHFARLLDFDLDQGIEYWADRLLINIDLEYHKRLTHTKLQQTVYEVVNHRWYNSAFEHSFGIFALYDPEMLPDELESKSFMEQYWIFIETELRV